MKAALSPRGRVALPRTALAAGVSPCLFFLVYVIVWAVVRGDARVPAVDVLNVAGPLLACVFCSIAAGKVSARNISRFWTVLAAAMFLSALAEATWAFYEVVRGIETPFPSVADLFRLVSYPLQFAAIVGLLSLGRRGRAATIGVGLEALIYSLATVLVVWEFVMLPSIDPSASLLANLVSAAYPGGDVLLLAALASLALLPKRSTMPLGFLWVAGAFLVDVVADLWYSVAQSAGTYSTGSWMDPLWPLAYTLLAVAAAWQLTGAKDRSAGQAEAASADGGAAETADESSLAAEPAPLELGGGLTLGYLTLRDQIRMIVPYVVAPVGIFLIIYSQGSDRDPAHLYSTGPMVGGMLLLALVLGRQAVTMLERNRFHASLVSLSQDLQNRVVQRTRELSLLNGVAAAMSQCGSSRQVIENGLRLAREALGCEDVGLVLRVQGSRQRFFGGESLKRSARARLLAAAVQVLEGGSGGNGGKPVDKPTVLDEVAVLPLVSRQASIGGLCLAPWVSNGTGTEAAGPPGSNGHRHVHGRPQLELASAVAAQIAVAFENARRFEDAHYLAERDPVTGLLNHRGMNERLEQELARCARIGGGFSVVMMDMDNFKLFNDTYGHAVGDEVLTTVAKVLGKAVRKYDVLARYGGDEFVALLPDTNIEGAMVVVKRLRAAIQEEAFYLERRTLNRIPIALSYGIATYPNQGRRVAEVMSAADANLYRSKSRGGDWITAPSATTVQRSNTKLGVFNVLDGLVTTVDNKDHYTRHHSDDVCEHALALACKMGLDAEHQRVLRTAAILHDVGKIGVPDSILRKPGSLNDEEFEAIKQHVVLGRLIIKEIPDLEEVLAAVSSHHERFDGVGYPDGLKGHNIPLLGRVLAVTDAYSAMTTDRPYRRALTPTEAIAELKRVSGKQLDPELVPLFVEVIEEEQSSLATVNLNIGR